MPLVFPPKPDGVFKTGVRNVSPKREGTVAVEPLTPTRAQIPNSPRAQMQNPTQNSPRAQMQNPPQNLPPRAQMQMQARTPMRSQLPPHKIAPLQHLLQPKQVTQMPAQNFSQMQNSSHMQKQTPQQNFSQTQNSSPPQNAAEKFQQVNKNLPDGVRYEPLDEETMKILRQKNSSQAQNISPQNIPAQVQNISSQNIPAQAQNISSQNILAQTQNSQAKFFDSPPMIPSQAQNIPAQPQNFSPMIPSQSFEQSPQKKSLPAEAELILEGLAQNERNAFVFYTHFAAQKESFAILAKDSKNRLEQYSALLSECFEKKFAPQETTINTELNLHDAISLAIFEESKGLVTLGNLSELATDADVEKIILRVINKKIIGQQILLSLR